MDELVKQKIVVVMGPTASGKTSLSIQLSKKFNGEVVSADSRQVYRGLDIGTAKVTNEEMDGVPHHLLDVADPKDTYSVSDYVRDGRDAIADILGRKRLPIIAGGTFFYVDNLLGSIDTPNVPPNPELRERLEEMSEESLFNALEKSDPRRAAFIDRYNKRRLIRALEIVEAVGIVPELASEEIYDNFKIGLKIDKEKLRENIKERIDSRMEEGMIEEVKGLLEDGLSKERMDELGLEYRYISRHLGGELSLDAMKEVLEQKTWQFAKRQLMWLRRDKNIHWFSPDETGEIESAVAVFLQNSN